ncbi:MAG: hypothetical protein AW07_02112 [Candidatus Accumulibacter sp. SK-11]|nr:MAG: hypothetical protein AW07_02112 [Candidatus Accumulibacter sp. SK-11]
MFAALARSSVHEATSTGPCVSVLQLVMTPVPEVPGVQLATNCEVGGGTTFWQLVVSPATVPGVQEATLVHAPMTGCERQFRVALAVQVLAFTHGLGQVVRHSREPLAGVQEATGDQPVQTVRQFRATSTV